MTETLNTTYKLLIIGSGPAARTAAIYAGRAGIRTAMFASSVTPGGDLMNTSEVENFPGFPEGIQGPDLMELLREQAEKFGTAELFEDVLSVDFETKTVTTDEGSYKGDAIIIATGSEYRKLNIPGEAEYTGSGVSWCATCDGFFFKDQDVAVIGGGDSAMEEALHLTHHARSVTLVNRSNTYRASKIMLERAFSHEKITRVEHKIPVEILGEDGQVVGLRVRDAITGEESDIPVEGVFVAIGSDPRTEVVKHGLALTSHGTLALYGGSRTSEPGVFAAGDVTDHTYRQAITAAGSGAKAALDAEKYLQAPLDSSSHMNNIEGADEAFPMFWNGEYDGTTELLTWLAGSREQIGYEDQKVVDIEVATIRRVVDLLTGKDDGSGWLPQDLLSEWAKMTTGNDGQTVFERGRFAEKYSEKMRRPLPDQG